MPKKRYYLPVLLLYIITSLFMLLLFAGLFYHHKKTEILEQSAFSLRDEARFIFHSLRRDDGKLDKRGGFSDSELILSVRKEMIIKDFEPDWKHIRELGEQSKKKQGFERFAFGGFVDRNAGIPKENLGIPSDLNAGIPNKNFGILKENVRQKSGQNITLFFSDDEYAYYAAIRDDTKLLLRSKTPISEINNMFFTLCFIVLIAAGVVCGVAFFIVRMSYAPLLAHIKGLNNFITDTTHEINTPLSVILMSVEMFEKNPQKYLANIKQASKTLSMLYSDLSANLKVMPLNISEVEFGAFLRQRVEFFELLAAKKQLKFELDITDFKAKSDVFRLGKIIDNLLSNAIKYSFAGQNIFIKLDKNAIEVAQKGAVIPPEKIDKIYDKFTRFDSANGGFGIGLSLVKSYCDELKYKISCSSDENQTKFKVEFQS